MSRTTAADRLRRVLAIVPHIVANPGIPVTELSKRFGIDEQALFADLSVVFMVGLPPYSPDSLIDVEIDDEGRVTIRLADYFSRPLKLTPGQALALVAASDALLSIPGTDPDGSLATALAKLGSVVGVGEAETVEVHLGAAELAVLERLRSAVGERRQIVIDYFGYGRDEVTTRRVSPWRVFADEGNWYLHGWCELADGERVFRVDRIERLDVTDVERHHEPGADYDGGSLFEPQPSHARITLRLQPSARWLIDTYPCEKVVERDDGAIEVVLAVGYPRWLERLLVRLGPQVQVIDSSGLDDAEYMAARAASRILDRYRSATPI